MITQLTTEGSLSRVRPPVDEKVAGEAEGFAAELAPLAVLCVTRVRPLGGALVQFATAVSFARIRAWERDT